MNDSAQSTLFSTSQSTLTFTHLATPQYFGVSLDPSSPHSYTCRVISSNPDNYIIKPCNLLLEPGQSAKIKVLPKIYENISSFNYVKNKIFVLYSPVPASKQSYLTIDIQVQEGLNDLYKQEEDYLRKLVKIQRYGAQEMTYQEFELIMKCCHQLGDVSRVRGFSEIIIIQFKNPIRFEPKLVMQDDFVFTMSYLSTFMGRVKMFEVGKDVGVDRMVESISCFKEKVICRTLSELYVYENLSVQPHKLNHSKCKVTQIDPYIFVAIQRHKLYLYQSCGKVTKIPTNEARVSCITSNSSYVFVAYQRYLTLGATEIPSKKQEVAIMRSLKCLDLDNSITVSKSSNTISILQCKQNLLFVYCFPVLSMYNIRSKQLLGKIEKEINKFSILEGVFAENYINAMGVDYNGKLYKINIELLDNYIGSEVIEYEQKCLKACASSFGYVYLLTHKTICSYDLGEKRVTEELLVAGKDEVFLDMVMNKNDELLVLKSRNQHKYIQILKIY